MNFLRKHAIWIALGSVLLFILASLWDTTGNTLFTFIKKAIIGFLGFLLAILGVVMLFFGGFQLAAIAIVFGAAFEMFDNVYQFAPSLDGFGAITGLKMTGFQAGGPPPTDMSISNQ